MVHVLCLDVSAWDEGLYQQLYQQASPERKARADRYRRREDALRCVAADALLRRVLGPEYGSIQKTPDGKPYLPERPDFHFNLSHGGKWVVLAYGPSPLGVDVESLRRDPNLHSIARRFFSLEEQAYVFAEGADSHQRFFKIWTGKEGYLKYLGTGLKKDLTSFSVLSPEPGVYFHWEDLPDGSHLCLCTRETAYQLEFL